MSAGSGVFVIGTDTEVGKTFQAALLARELVRNQIRVGVYKPVASGAISTDQSDAARLREAARLDCELSRVCPQHFRAPVAPPVAAEAEGKQVDERLLIAGAHWWQDQCDFLIVEGAGGALSPLSDSLTVLDLAEQLQLPLILVAANRLGVVNHALLTLESIRLRQLAIVGIVLNDIPYSSPHLTENSALLENSARPDLTPGQDPSKTSNLHLLRKFTKTPVVTSASELIPDIWQWQKGREQNAPASD